MDSGKPAFTYLVIPVADPFVSANKSSQEHSRIVLNFRLCLLSELLTLQSLNGGNLSTFHLGFGSHQGNWFIPETLGMD
jgi:hypothetical protein